MYEALQENNTVWEDEGLQKPFKSRKFSDSANANI
jgi:hypothetical protein